MHSQDLHQQRLLVPHGAVRDALQAAEPVDEEPARSHEYQPFCFQAPPRGAYISYNITALRQISPEGKSEARNRHVLYHGGPSEGMEDVSRDLALAGKLKAMLEHVLEQWDLGYQDVHAKILVGDMAFSAVGRPTGPCELTYRVGERLKSQPFVGGRPGHRPGSGQALPRDGHRNQSLHCARADLDPLHPATWHRLLCSHFVILFLRYCHTASILPLPERKLQVLWSEDSVKWTPAHLRRKTQDIGRNPKLTMLIQLTSAAPLAPSKIPARKCGVRLREFTPCSSFPTWLSGWRRHLRISTRA